MRNVTPLVQGRRTLRRVLRPEEIHLTCKRVSQARMHLTFHLLTCKSARQVVFEDIDMLDIPKRKQSSSSMLSLVEFEVRQKKLNAAGV